MRFLFDFLGRVRTIGRCQHVIGLGTTYHTPFGGHFPLYCGKERSHTDRHGACPTRQWRHATSENLGAPVKASELADLYDVPAAQFGSPGGPDD